MGYYSAHAIHRGHFHWGTDEDTPYFASEGQVWGVACDCKFLPKFCHCDLCDVRAVGICMQYVRESIE